MLNFRFSGTKLCTPSAPEKHDQTICEGKIYETEIAEALKGMKNGSAPGNHGLTTELYKISG